MPRNVSSSNPNAASSAMSDIIVQDQASFGIHPGRVTGATVSSSQLSGVINSGIDPTNRSQDAVRKADVGVIFFAGQRIGARRADRKPRVGGRKPANRVVADIGWIPVRIVWLLVHDDGVLQADLLECFVPEQRALTHRVAVLHRDRIFHPEDDRLRRPRQSCRRILFFERANE